MQTTSFNQRDTPYIIITEKLMDEMNAVTSSCGTMTYGKPSHMSMNGHHNQENSSSVVDCQNYETMERCQQSPPEENHRSKQGDSLKRSPKEEKLNKVLRRSGRVCPVYDNIVENIRQALLSVDPALHTSLPVNLDEKKRSLSSGETGSPYQCKCKDSGGRGSATDVDDSPLATYILLYNGKEMEAMKLREELVQKDAVLVTYVSDLDHQNKRVAELERELRANQLELRRCQKELEQQVLLVRSRTHEAEEMTSMVSVYQSQASAYKEDFAQEREDREKAQMKIQDLITELKIKNEVISWTSPKSMTSGVSQGGALASPAQIEYVAECPYKAAATKTGTVECDGESPRNDLNSPGKSPRASVVLLKNPSDTTLHPTPELHEQKRQVRDLSRDPDLLNYIVVEQDRRQHALSRHIMSPSRSVPVLPDHEPRKRRASSMVKTPSLDSSQASSHHGRIFDCSSSSGQTTPSRGSGSPYASPRSCDSRSTVRALCSRPRSCQHDDLDNSTEGASASVSSVASNLQCPKCALPFPTELHMEFIDHLDECCR